MSFKTGKLVISHQLQQMHTIFVTKCYSRHWTFKDSGKITVSLISSFTSLPAKNYACAVQQLLLPLRGLYRWRDDCYNFSI